MISGFRYQIALYAVLFGCSTSSCSPAPSTDWHQQSLIGIPTITSVSRPVCRSGGGCTVQIDGIDIDPLATAYIDGQVAPTVNFSGNSIGVVAPGPRTSSINKWLDVRVENGPGLSHTLPRSFLYYGDDVDFGVPRSPSVPSSIANNTSADVNKDGRPDLVVATTSGSLYVLFATGSRTYSAPMLVGSTGYAYANYPIWITTADINEDGHLDIIVSHYFGITTFMNSGIRDGTFTTRRYSASYDISRITVADVTADGAQDLIACDTFGGLLVYQGKWATGKPSGEFDSMTRFPLGVSSPRDLVVSDINADGRPDAVLTTRSGTVIAYNTVGSADMPAPTKPFDPNNAKYRKTLLATEAFYGLAVADLNGDGRPDLATTREGSLDAQIFLQATDGNFPLTPSSTSTVGGFYTTVNVLDYTGDGRPDLLLSGSSTPPIDRMALLVGGGSGTFPVPYSPIDLGVPGGRVSVADLDKDGRLDFVVSSAQLIARPVGREFLTLLYGTAGGFETSVGFNAGVSGSILTALVGFEASSGQQVVAAADGPSNVVRLFQVQEDGTLKLTTSSLRTGNYPGLIAKGDFNGDSFVDLLVGNYRGNSLSLFLGNGTADFTYGPVDFALSAAPMALVVGDYDNNFIPEAAVLTSDGKVHVVKSDGMGTLSKIATLAGDNSARALEFVDLTGDKRDDIVATSPTTGQIAVWISGTTGFSAMPDKQIATEGVRPVGLHTLDDINGDGRRELVVVHQSAKPGQEDNVRVLASDPMALFKDDANLAFESCLQPVSAQSTDINSDGSRDLMITCREATGLRTEFWLDVGRGYLGPAQMKINRMSGGAITPLLDSRGRTSLIVADELKGRLYVLKGI